MAVAAKSSVLDEVRAIVVSTIRIGADKLDVEAAFADLGIDSIIAMELMERLSRHFGIAFTPSQFLRVNTVSELARFIEANFKIEREQAAPEAAQEDVPLRDLLASVQDKYAVDLTGRRWSSIDEIVDELVSNNLERVIESLDVDGILDGDEPASPARVSGGDVAIVGISCRFPDALGPEAFWDNLLNRKSSIREIPKSRWDWESCYAPCAAAGKTISKWGALIDDIDCFDPDFFGIGPQEAKLIDPQERLLMQEMYQALQDAGMDARKLAGSSTGVFVGYEYAEYEQYLRRNMHRIPGLVSSSSSPTYYLANRLSFVFDFRGPSESINVNCASSAVAINRAYLSLIHGESELAVVGSACLHLFADDYVTSSQYGLLSPDGTCAVFDNDANGFTRGEGVGALVLKRLDSAIADNDRIYAVIKACHQNNRGSGKTLSDVKHEAITDVISRCYEKASLSAESISYIELNGYAKKWADSFEFDGIRNAFAATAAPGKRCALGSLKGNIGHLEPVNGIAGVIKVALSLHHKKFPPTITRRATSTFIDLESPSHPLYFADTEIAFEDIRKDANTPIRAGVSSFADSGVNVHIALEEFLPQEANRPAAVPAAPQLFVLSAKDRHRLADYVDAYIAFLADAREPSSFADLIHSSQVGREAMEARLAIIASSCEELCSKLRLVGETGIEGGSRREEQGIFHGDLSRAETISLASLVTADMTGKQLELSVRTGEWQPIASLWVHGVDIPWKTLWAGKAVQRVALPGYPFARDRYWIDSGDAAIRPPVAARDPRAEGSVAQAEARAAVASMDMEPAAKLELFLRQEIARLQRCAVEDIGLDSNLVALGMSSIGIADLVTRANDLMQVNLAPSSVFKYPQVRGLARYLALSFPEKAAGLVVPAHSGAPAGPASTPDVLVPMQSAGTRAPIFLVPGADGSVLSLKRLCEALGDQQPLYGLESLGLDGKTLQPGSVGEIAQVNIAALRTVQPHGPYRLLGYSNGGVVAFEMARALLEQGEAIESLMLLDSLCPAVRKSTEVELVAEVFTHLIATLGGKLDLDVRALEQVARHERGDYLHRLLSAHAMELAREPFIATYDVATASEALCRAYSMPKLSRPIDVSLFRAVEGYKDVPDDYGWNRFLLQPVRIHDIEANHFSIIEDGPVSAVADAIKGLAANPAPSAGARGKPKSRRARNAALSGTQGNGPSNPQSRAMWRPQ
jgi:acyl carrier protein